MKIAIISDIHANFEALKAALEYIKEKEIHRIVCLGDVVGYGPRPNECVEFVKKRCEVCLMGNHDHATLGLTDIYYFNQYAQEAVLWTQRKLTSYNRAYLETLPYTFVLDNILFVHSTPIQPEEWHYVLSEYEACQYMDQIPYRLVFIGHSHIPVIFSYNDGSVYQERIDLNIQDRYIINVGSVGQPRDGDPRLCFVVYDREEQIVEFVRIEYDVKKTYQEIIDNQLPPFLAMRLLSGH